MLVSVIVLNWNGLKELRPCLAAIAENTLVEDHEVIVLDNGSEEPGVEDAVRPYPRVRLIKEPINHGFSRGNNLAARESRAEYLAFLNNDTVPRRDWLRPLIETHRAVPDAGIVGSMQVNEADTIVYGGSYFQPSINSYFGVRRDYPIECADGPRECDIYNGCGILMKRELFDAVGGFDEHYIHGWEDYDLCLKVRERGLKIIHCPASVIVHLGAVSTRKLSRSVLRRNKRSNVAFFEQRWRERLYEFRLPKLPDGMDDFSPYVPPSERLFDQVPARAGRVLEVGCGTGVLGERLKLSGKAAHVTGVESRAYAAALARSRLDTVEIADVESMPLDAWIGTFDTLIVADGLARMRDPWTALFRLRNCLKDGGMVIASIPNIAHYKIMKKLLFRDWRYETGGTLDHRHLRFFTRGSIDDLFRNAGFEILSIACEGGERWWWRLLGAFSPRFRDLAAAQYIITARKRAPALRAS